MLLKNKNIYVLYPHTVDKMASTYAIRYSLNTLFFTESSTSSTSFWYCLPVELWLNIFKPLPQPTLLFVIRKVCRMFRDLSLDPELWRTVDLNSTQWKDFDPKLIFGRSEISSNDSVIVSQLLKDIVESVARFDSVAKMDEQFSEDNKRDIFPFIDVYKNIDEILEYCDEHVMKKPSKLHCPSIIFVPLLNSIHLNIKKLYLSRSSDFILTENMFDQVGKCKNLTHLDLGFCELVDNNRLSSILHYFSSLVLLGLEGCECVSIIFLYLCTVVISYWAINIYMCCNDFSL